MRAPEATCDGLNDDQQRTCKAYDRWSRVWDFARFTNRAIYDSCLELLAGRHRKVLDVGCGTGLMCAKLAASGREVVGVDLSTAMIQRARRQAHPNIHFVRGDAEALPVDDESFDAVVNLISFHHYARPARAAAEFRRALRPGGRLILIAFDRSSRYITLAQKTNRWIRSIAGTSWQKTSAEIVAVLREAGFTTFEVHPVRYWIKTFAIVAERS